MAGGEIFRRGQAGTRERAVVSGQGAQRAEASLTGPQYLAEQFRDRLVTRPDVERIRDLKVKIESMGRAKSVDVASFEARIETARQSEHLTWTPPAWRPAKLSPTILGRLASVQKASRATHRAAEKIALTIVALDRTTAVEQEETAE